MSDFFSSPAPARARQIVILGMHRSGTSALAGALAAMGVYAGRDEELTSPSSDNPRGFFERQDARRICDALLQDNHADWWKINQFAPDGLSQESRSRQHRPLSRLVEHLDRHGHWLLKEPRLCLLFPFFRRALKDPMVIMAIRHPAQVAASLRRRNGFSSHAGLALWEAYTLAMLRHGQTEPHILVRHDALVADPERELKILGDWLADHGVAGLDVAAGAARIETGRALNPPTEALLSHSQRALWHGLVSEGVPSRIPDLSVSARLTLQEFEEDQLAQSCKPQIAGSKPTATARPAGRAITLLSDNSETSLRDAERLWLALSPNYQISIRLWGLTSASLPESLLECDDLQWMTAASPVSLAADLAQLLINLPGQQLIVIGSAAPPVVAGLAANDRHGLPVLFISSQEPSASGCVAELTPLINAALAEMGASGSARPLGRLILNDAAALTEADLTVVMSQLDQKRRLSPARDPAAVAFGQKLQAWLEHHGLAGRPATSRPPPP